MRDILEAKEDMNIKESSLQLIRTNPKLSGNLKIIIDSKSDLYLSTFDNIPSLSNINMKKFPIHQNEFYGDALKRFITNTKIVINDIYTLQQNKKDSNIDKNFKNFYEDLYWNGARYKDSLLFTERISINTTLWLTKQIPKYFLVFKAEGPFSKDGHLDSFDGESIQDWINEFKIIKTFDCGEESKLGIFLRNIVNNSEFNEMPLKLSLDSTKGSEFRGISLESGKFSSYYENLNKELSIIDKTIMEREDSVIKGFSRGNLICANLINLEFLLDENVSSSMNRYFGIFCDFDIQENFSISESKNSNFNRFFPTQSINDWNHLSDSSRIVNNSEGVVLFYDNIGVDLIDSNFLESKRFFSVLDCANNLYSVSSKPAEVLVLENNNNVISTIIDEKDFVRLKNSEIDLSNFVKYGLTQKTLKIVEVGKEVLNYPNCFITLKDIPASGDSIRIRYVDSLTSDFNTFADSHTIIASNSLQPGEISLNTFSNLGSLSSICKAIVKSINNISEETGYKAFTNGKNSFVVFTLSPSTLRNLSILQLYTSKTSEVFEVLENCKKETTFNFLPTPILTSFVQTSGILTSVRFLGLVGNGLRISLEDLRYLENLKKSKGNIFFNLPSNQFYKIGLLEESFDNSSFCRDLTDLKFDLNGNAISSEYINKYCYITNQDVLVSNFFVSVYEEFFNSIGLLAIYPIVDFDYRFKESDYSNRMFSNRLKLLEFLTNGVIGSYTTIYPNTVLNINLILDLLNDNSNYVKEGEDYRIFKEGVDLVSEYDFLKENELKELALVSKSVPWLVKWVKKDEDVRNVNYRIPITTCFSTCFSPSFKEFSINPKHHTHEWPFISSKIPHLVLNSEEAEKYYDYIKEGFDINQHLIDDNYFIDNLLLKDYEGVEIDKRFLWSKFTKDTSTFYGCFFRGVEVLIKQKTDNTSINYNTESLNTSQNQNFEDYKFSVVLIPKAPGHKIKIYKNDINKSVLLGIEADFFDDIINSYIDGFDTKTFVDRVHLYTNKHKLVYDIGTNSFKYADVQISGAISSWNIVGTKFVFTGSLNTLNNTNPDFLSEIHPSANGNYSNIIINVGTDVLVISQISKVTSTTIEALSLTLNAIPILVSSQILSVSILYGQVVGNLNSGLYTYIEGGYLFLERILEKICFAQIADDINLGNPAVEYKTKLIDGTIVENEFVLELREPYLNYINNYLKSVEDERPPYLKNQYGSIGSTLVLNDRVSTNAIYRYSGDYRPKFIEMSKFSIEPTNLGLTKSINRNHRFFEDFLILKEFYYNKVSPNNSESVLISSNLSNVSNVYPKIGEVNVDSKDKNLCNSSIDFKELFSYKNKKNFEESFGLLANKVFVNFGSSVVELIPDNFLFDVFSPITYSTPISNLENTNISSRNLIYAYMDKKYYKFTIDVEKMLTDKLYLIFNEIFTPYLNSSNSLSDFLNEKFGSLENFLKNYIYTNLVKRYEVSLITFYKRPMNLNESLNISTNSLDLFYLNISELEKVSNFSKDSNFNLEFRNSAKLNVDLKKSIDNLANIYSFSIRCSIR